LTPCVEKRWATVELALAMLAFALHPGHVIFARRLVHKTDMTNRAMLGNFAVFYWHRLIDNAPGKLRGDLMLRLDGDLQPKVQPSEYHSIQVCNTCLDSRTVADLDKDFHCRPFYTTTGRRSPRAATRSERSPSRSSQFLSTQLRASGCLASGASSTRPSATVSASTKSSDSASCAPRYNRFY